MLNYIIRRVFAGTIALFIVAALVFFLMRTIPGGPFDQERTLPAAIIESLNEYYGLDDPLWKQFYDYITNALQGDFGRSFSARGMKVSDLMLERVPVSAELGVWATLFAVCFGIPLGVIAAYNHNTWIDYTASFFAIVGRSVPSIAIAPLLILVFGLYLEWFPIARWESWDSRVLPTLALGLLSGALISRLTRASMLQVIRDDYIRTARAKGLSETRILFKHALRNALIPVVSILGLTFAGLICGSFVIEMIHAIPGLGLYYITSISNRDYPVVMSTTLMFSFLIILVNIIVDVSYAFLDPRIRLD